MFNRRKLNVAVASAIAATLGSAAANAKVIEEVTVTATKQAKSMEAVPVTVSALTQKDMQEQNVNTFADYVQALPSISVGGRGPGQNSIYIRGTAIQGINTSIAEANGNEPNVGLYLDEQPVTAGGRNLDVYMADMQRIEVLPGPQGTLYGASSMAGTVKLITNKPILDQFEGKFTGGSSFTKYGDMSNTAVAVMNLPILQDRLAVRAVMFSDNRGGYIDNKEGSFTPDPTQNPVLPPTTGVMFVPAGGSPTAHQFADGTYAVPGQVYPVRYTSVPNGALAKENFNDSSYHGFRISAKYVVNPNWDVLVQRHQQRIHSDGVFDYDPNVGDLQVKRFNPEYLEEQFSQTAVTVNGRVGTLQLLYTGAYLQRKQSQMIDYSNYANTGLYVRGYLCEYNTPGYHGGGGVGYTFDPTLSGDPGVIECSAGNGFARMHNKSHRWTHEFRINTDQAKRLRFTGGVFYEDEVTHSVGDFGYGNPAWAPIDPSQINPIVANDRNIRSPRIQFTNDITRPRKQTAVFGELTFDLTKNVSATLGLRWYKIKVAFEGFSAWKYGNRPVPNLANGNNANGIILEADGNNSDGTSLAPNITGGRDYLRNIGPAYDPFTVKDHISKFTLNWFATNRVMLYATYSEGFRPPGFNRAVAASPLVQIPGQIPTAAAIANDGPGGFPDYFIPLIYQSDTLKNYEFGWKTTLLDGQMRFNGSAYYVNWDKIQVPTIDSQRISFLTIVDNAGDAVIKGVEGNLTWYATDRLSLYGSFSYNDTRLTAINPAFAFAVAPVGSELPLAPKLQFNLRGRYEWEAAGGLAHVQLSANHATKAYSSLIVSPPRRFEQKPYTIVDGSVGFSKESWSVELFASNLTDERAQLDINTLDGSTKILTNRPLTVGLRMTYDIKK